MVKIGVAYGVSVIYDRKDSNLDIVKRGVESEGPTLFEVQLDPEQESEPRLRSRIDSDGKILTPSLEDMYPFLPPDELACNMLAEEDK